MSPYPNLARFSEATNSLASACAHIEEAIVDLVSAQDHLTPNGPLGSFIALLEADLVVCQDNQSQLIEQIRRVIDEVIESQHSESDTRNALRS